MENYNDVQENTLRDFLRILFRRKIIAAATFISGVTAVFIGLGLNVMVYEGRVKMLISAEKFSESPYYKDLTGRSSSEIVLSQSEIVRSTPVIERAVKVLELYKRTPEYENQFAFPVQLPILNFKHALFRFIGRLLSPEAEKIPLEQKQVVRFWETVADLKDTVVVEPVEGTNMFTIVAVDFTPLGAAVLANVISRSYVIYDLEQQLAGLQIKYGERYPAYIQLKDDINRMIAKFDGNPLPNIEAIGPASVKIIEQAPMPLHPQWILPFIAIVLGFVFSAMLGVVFAFVSELMDQTLKSSKDVEKILNLPFLGGVLKKKSKDRLLIGDGGEITPYIQSHQNLSEHIYLLLKDKNFKSLLITSALRSEGATTVIANTGICLSGRLAHKVLIIDADLRNPSLHAAFGIPETAGGLAAVLEGRIPFEKAVNKCTENLAVLPAGRTALNPITLLSSRAMAELVETAKAGYEIVLMDCSNLNSFKDAQALSSFSDAVVLLVKEGAARRQVLLKTIASLKRRNVCLLGAVLSYCTYSIPRMIYERV